MSGVISWELHITLLLSSLLQNFTTMTNRRDKVTLAALTRPASSHEEDGTFKSRRLTPLVVDRSSGRDFAVGTTKSERRAGRCIDTTSHSARLRSCGLMPVSDGVVRQYCALHGTENDGSSFADWQPHSASTSGSNTPASPNASRFPPGRHDPLRSFPYRETSSASRSSAT